MRKARFIENCRCYHLISRLAHQAFFLGDDVRSNEVVGLLFVPSLYVLVRPRKGKGK